MLLVIAIILLVLLVSMTSYEHMTNKDVISAMKNFGVDDTTTSINSPNIKVPIYGPKTDLPFATEPTPNDKKAEEDSLRRYPDIYGPDTSPQLSYGRITVNEKIPCSGDDGSYDYNVNLKTAFPTEGPPQPFLADFSSFQS